MIHLKKKIFTLLHSLWTVFYYIKSQQLSKLIDASKMCLQFRVTGISWRKPFIFSNGQNHCILLFRDLFFKVIISLDGQESEEEQLKPPCIDLSDYKLKIDHFDQMHALTDENRLEGADNFRQVIVMLALRIGI